MLVSQYIAVDERGCGKVDNRLEARSRAVDTARCPQEERSIHRLAR